MNKWVSWKRGDYSYVGLCTTAIWKIEFIFVEDAVLSCIWKWVFLNHWAGSLGNAKFGGINGVLIELFLCFKCRFELYLNHWLFLGLKHLRGWAAMSCCYDSVGDLSCIWKLY